MLFWCLEKRGQHLLQLIDQHIGLAVALQQCLDCFVLSFDLASQERVLALKPLDIPTVVVGSCRDLSRRFVSQGPILNGCIAFSLDVATCRDRSCHVATSRDRFLDVGNVLGDRFRGDQPFFSDTGINKAALEMAFGTIALDASRSAGKAGLSVQLEGFVDGEGEITVGGRRDLSRLVGGHVLHSNSFGTKLLGRYPQVGRKSMSVTVGPQNSLSGIMMRASRHGACG